MGYQLPSQPAKGDVCSCLDASIVCSKLVLHPHSLLEVREYQAQKLIFNFTFLVVLDGSSWRLSFLKGVFFGIAVYEQMNIPNLLKFKGVVW